MMVAVIVAGIVAIGFFHKDPLTGQNMFQKLFQKKKPEPAPSGTKITMSFGGGQGEGSAWAPTKIEMAAPKIPTPVM